MPYRRCGFAAKEVIVSTLATMHGIEESDDETEAEAQADAEDGSVELDSTGKRLAQTLRSYADWSPLKAFAILLLLCFTIHALRRAPSFGGKRVLSAIC
ncbi:hypothetical protein FACS1894170_10580 [Planctomycetales bacterium]|nr:hypothetical protein FACS1894170_10580 [Planctomycetales bacterium]